MKKTLTVYSSNRESPQAFTRSVERLMMAGCPVIPQTGSADVTLARNQALTAVVRALKAGTQADVVLMVDDDMSFDLSAVDRIASYVRRTGVAASASYVMGDGRLAARFVGPKWETGLGFLGIPAAKILSLSEDSPLFVGTADGGLVHEFTRSGVVESDKGRIWEPEDFHLCRRLGGVDLLDLRIAHLKTVPLSPNPEMLRALIDKHEIRPSAEELAEFTESMTAIAK